MKSHIQWAAATLKELGYVVKSTFPEKIQQTPWSEMYCFLMHEAGITLREFFKQSFHEDVFIQAIQYYSEIQLITKNNLRGR